VAYRSVACSQFRRGVPRFFLRHFGYGIIGGAVVPVIIGRIGDHAGLRNGLAFLYITFGFVLSVGFWARPVINNATIRLKKASAELLD